MITRRPGACDRKIGLLKEDRTTQFCVRAALENATKWASRGSGVCAMLRHAPKTL